jgi:hypothetical protein
MASTTPQPPVMPPPVAPQAPPGKKATSPLVWILAGCGGLILICAVVMMAGGYFLAHKVKGYAEIAKKNPAMAAAKMMVAFNPEVEIVAEDDDRGIITIRNKKTGEEITMNAEDIKAGKLKFKNEKGEEVTFEGHGEGGKGGLTIKSNKGETTFGTGNAQSLPSWVPSYPGVTPITSMSKSSGEGIYGNYSFQTSDAGAKVLEFYQSAFKASGFTVERTDVGGGTTGMGNLNAKSDGGKREVNVSVVPAAGAVTVTVQYTSAGASKG